MKKYIVFLTIIFCIEHISCANGAFLVDSLGVTSMNGYDYIVHEVETGETLYALSRKYDVDVQSIKDANTESVSNLNVGQKVLIPYSRKSVSTNGTIHKVKSSETLFSISRQYDVKVDDLVEWNNLTGNSISVGQELIIKESEDGTMNKGADPDVLTNDHKTHIVEQSQTLYSISRMYGVSTEDLRSWNNLESDGLKIGQILVVSDSAPQSSGVVSSNSSMLPSTGNDNANVVKSQPAEVAKPIVTTSPIVRSDLEPTDEVIEKPAEKVIQKGFAEVIENTADTKKYLALHRDAPVGTIMQVKNEMNSQSVFVRIVGPIPATGDNSKLILKISKKAYDRLGAVDNRFPVEISYIP